MVYIDEETSTLAATAVGKHPRGPLLPPRWTSRSACTPRAASPACCERACACWTDAYSTCRLIDRPLRPAISARAWQPGAGGPEPPSYPLHRHEIYNTVAINAASMSTTLSW
ncbi:hypothetical protein QJS66_06650 [Kocuria rhizophila]|nr:hypothetical protein QJS66_06650 [Kocuria rhizophila]